MRVCLTVAGWAPVLAPPVRVARWLAVGVALTVWRAAEPYLRDAAGWLVHTAPGLLARWTARQLARLAR